jgi:hypothetical protein
MKANHPPKYTRWTEGERNTIRTFLDGCQK